MDRREIGEKLLLAAAFLALLLLYGSTIGAMVCVPAHP